MSSKPSSSDEDILNFFNDSEKVTKALQAGIQLALLWHKKMGNPICVSRNGKIIWIPPEEILVENNKLFNAITRKIGYLYNLRFSRYNSVM